MFESLLHTIINIYFHFSRLLLFASIQIPHLNYGKQCLKLKPYLQYYFLDHLFFHSENHLVIEQYLKEHAVMLLFILRV